MHGGSLVNHLLGTWQVRGSNPGKREKNLNYSVNVITLGQCQSDNINGMITLTEDNIYKPYELYFKFRLITELKIFF